MDFLDFSEALRAMKEGSRVRRRSWPDGKCVEIERDGFRVYHDKMPRPVEISVFIAEDLLAEDWWIVP